MGGSAVNLWRRVDEVTRSALDSGALVPIETSCEVHRSGGIPYQLRVLVKANPKTTASRPQRPRVNNPFLPPEPDLLVDDLTPTHFAVLNKFNVVDRHLLVVTHEFVDQNAPLTMADFEALLVAMQGTRCLGFYNGGLIGGASQPHRHLQVVPLPMVPATGGLPTPVDAVIGDEGVDASARCSGLPFRHRLELIGADDFSPSGAPGLHDLFFRFCSELGITRGVPFNFLVTPRWFMVVPRGDECFEGISVNALGFAGSLLVPNDTALRRLVDVGPGRVLGSLT
jgi:ATP adenylyltransferase